MGDREYVVRDNPEELRYEILRGGGLVGEIRDLVVRDPAVS
jgi:hypothetical protein